MDEQPRLTDLVPLHLGFFLIPLVAGLAVIAGLEALYAWSSQLASMTTDGHIAAFDLDTEGSLGTWFSSTILLLAALVAVLVYTIRRHRTDDYQGYYRIWLWAASCWVLMSIDEGSSLHEGFKELMAYVTGTRLFGDGSIWWVVPYFFLLGAVGTRLLIDMRRCLLSSAALIGTAACYAVAVLAQLGWILPDAGAREVMVEEGAEMLADLLVFLAMALHARYVILDAQGLLPQRTPKTRNARADASDLDDQDEAEEEIEAESDEEVQWASRASVTVHPPHGIPRPATPALLPSKTSQTAAQTPRSLFQAAKPNAASAGLAQSDSPVQRKLTKGERKALRQRLEKMRAAREGRQGE